MSDDSIGREIIRALRWDRRLDATNIHVEVQRGRVTLRGSVRTREERIVANMNALAVCGVREVHNQLRSSKERSGIPASCLPERC